MSQYHEFEHSYVNFVSLKVRKEKVIIENGDISWQSQSYTILKDNI